MWFVDAPGGKIEPDAKKLRTAACLKMEPCGAQSSRKPFAIFPLKKAEADTGVDFEALRRRIPTMSTEIATCISHTSLFGDLWSISD